MLFMLPYGRAEGPLVELRPSVPGSQLSNNRFVYSSQLRCTKVQVQPAREENPPKQVSGFLKIID